MTSIKYGDFAYFCTAKCSTGNMLTMSFFIFLKHTIFIVLEKT